MSKRNHHSCSEKTVQVRYTRSDPARQLRGLILVCAVAIVAFVSASVATLHTARADQIHAMGNNTLQAGKSDQLAFHFPGPSTDPAKTGAGAAVEWSYASEVGPSPLPFIQAGFDGFHNTPAGRPREPLPLGLLTLLVCMLGGMLTITITMWRDTGRTASSIKAQPVARQSRFHH